MSVFDHMKRNTWIVDKNAQGVDDGTMLTPVAGDNQRQSANLKPGVYLIVDKTGTGQASIAMMQGTGVNGMTTLQGTQNGSQPYALGLIEYKTHTVAVSKKITGVSDHGAVTADGMGAATQIGGTITMQLSSHVPNTVLPGTISRWVQSFGLCECSTSTVFVSVLPASAAPVSFIR